MSYNTDFVEARAEDIFEDWVKSFFVDLTPLDEECLYSLALDAAIAEANYMRNLSLTEAEESALVNLFLFVHDLGVPPHLEEDDAFDSLWEKVSDPSPFDYS